MPPSPLVCIFVASLELYRFATRRSSTRSGMCARAGLMNNVDISYTFIAKAMLRDSLMCAPARRPLFSSIMGSTRPLCGLEEEDSGSLAAPRNIRVTGSNGAAGLFCFYLSSRWLHCRTLCLCSSAPLVLLSHNRRHLCCCSWFFSRSFKSLLVRNSSC